MLGHKLWQTCAQRFEAYVTFRQAAERYARYGMFDPARSLGGVTAENFDSVVRVVDSVRPDVILNSIGIVKQDPAAENPLASIAVNALFPHQLAQVCGQSGARLIHLSTDCVFSGRKGNYAETDTADAEDLYGRTKLLGEAGGENCLTIRTSMIGRELQGAHGLLEWFLSQEGGRVRGFKRAVFSGLTTQALADMLVRIVSERSELSGIWHVTAEPINKFDLLSLVKEVYGLNVDIDPDESFACDRSLEGTHFRAATGFEAPTWPKMIARMRDDPTPYNEFRRVHADK